MRLSIPHVTQTGNAARNDCGPAVVAMLAGSTVEEAITACRVPANQSAHVGDIMRGLKYFGIQSKYDRLHVAQIRGYLADGYPVICLIDYGRVPDSLRRSQYKGAHFVLACGYDAGSILVHDPLGSAETGAYIPYQDVLLSAVMRHVPGNYFNDQCLIVMGEYEAVEETAVSPGTEAASPALQLLVIFKRLGVTDLGAALVRIGEMERGGRRPL